MSSYCFIITRNVRCIKTNEYWNNCIKLLRYYYPYREIIIIDDNSNYEFVKSFYEYDNIRIIQSEYPKRGELLPYYYFLKYKFADNAVIIHDSTFIHKRLNFEKLNNINVLPLWHFINDNENINNTKNILRYLKNNYYLNNKLNNEPIMTLSFNDKFYGCFGCQCYINYNFLYNINIKYNLINLINVIKCRADRCCLERILGCIFYSEYPLLLKQKSLLGDIMKYHKWNYNYDDYKADIKNGKIPKIILKVWTGR